MTTEHPFGFEVVSPITAANHPDQESSSPACPVALQLVPEDRAAEHPHPDPVAACRSSLG